MIILTPIYGFHIHMIYQTFELKTFSWMKKFKIILYLLAFLSDNIAALFLIQPKKNFEDIFYYSHYFSLFLITIAMLIPADDLNCYSEMVNLCSNLKKLRFPRFSTKKNLKNYLQMIPLNASNTLEIQIIDTPKEDFENIELKNDPNANKEKNGNEGSPVCLFTFFFICLLMFFFLMDLFAKMKRILSLMDDPKQIDFFNYSIFLIFLYVLLGRNNKNLFMDKKKRLKQGYFVFYFYIIYDL